MSTKILSLKEGYRKVEAPMVGEFDFEHSAALLYHENSKLDYFSSRMLGYNIQKMDIEYIHERASRPYKTYPGSNVVRFGESTVDTVANGALKELIDGRRSARSFAPYPITEAELHTILHYSYGINRRIPINNDGAFWGRRAIPSAGALYPLEIYVLIFQGAFGPGLYHFRPDENALEIIREGDFREEVASAIVVDASIDIDVNSASCLIITSGMFERVMSKYLERGYRFMMIELGALGQQITLMCESIGLGSCYVGSFWDDEINRFMGFDGISESVQTVIAIGKEKDNS